MTHFEKADVGFGWGVALFVVALVPADVVLVRHSHVPAALCARRAPHGGARTACVRGAWVARR